MICAKVVERDKQVLSRGTKMMTMTLTTEHGQRYLRTTRVPLINDDKEIYGLCGIDLDITAQKSTNTNCVIMHYDPLTGLANRVLFQKS